MSDDNSIELALLKARLFRTPEVFSHEEFDDLCAVLALTLSDIEPLIARRLRCRAKDPLERNALLAIIEGNAQEAERLLRVISKRNELGLRVLTSQPDPPHS